jgi:translation initiation factor 5A
VSTSKTGKHGHAKANFTAIDIFNGKKLEDIVPTTHSTMVPNVKRLEYSLLDISDDGFLSLLDVNGGNLPCLRIAPVYVFGCRN